MRPFAKQIEALVAQGYGQAAAQARVAFLSRRAGFCLRSALQTSRSSAKTMQRENGIICGTKEKGEDHASH